MNKLFVIAVALLIALASSMAFSAANIEKGREAVLNATSPSDSALCDMMEPDCGQ